MDESFPLFRKATLITENFPHINIFPSFFLPFYLFFSPSRPSVSWVKMKYLFFLHSHWIENNKQFMLYFVPSPSYQDGNWRCMRRRMRFWKVKRWIHERRRCHGALPNIGVRKSLRFSRGSCWLLGYTKIRMLGMQKFEIQKFFLVNMTLSAGTWWIFLGS